MSRFSLLAAALVLTVSTSACAQNPQNEHLINQAIAAAPDSLKDGAKVLSYKADGTFMTVREGDNGLVCTADDPNREGFEVACFHQELEAYISRGRELRADGMSGRETVAKRGEEIQSGTLEFTDGPAIQYIRFGDEAMYDETSGEVLNSRLRFVIYTPYSTPESTGLSPTPLGPGAPWIMDSGSWRAHIMITPPGQ